MQYLDNQEYLLDLLKRDQLISAEQEKLIRARLSSKRRRPAGRSGKKLQKPEEETVVDITVALSLKIPGKKNEVLSEERIMRSLAGDVGLPFKKIDPLELDLEVVTKTLPRSFALKHHLLPVEVADGTLHLVLCEPGNLNLIEEIEQASQLKVRPFLSTRGDIKKILQEFFGFQSSISAAETHLKGPTVDLSNLEQYVKISTAEEVSSSDQHIKSAVDHLFNYAFQERASDIHIEPKRETSAVRLRIDGVLHTIYELPKAIHAALISRIKYLSRLDIAEKRRPQDGRIKVDRGGVEAEIRVSTIPVAFGEKAVLRILSTDILFQNPENLGFSERDYRLHKSFMEASHGMVLVTGPTGSGKSTTLYSTLRAIYSPRINIVTIEDPVEMVYEEFNQISVQPRIGITFDSILRNILRQDPDVIMVGEIRDAETAAYAVQAALTGHLVFSTLHTNDAVSAVTRLLELGVQPFLLGSTVVGAMAQRLVRTICPHCIETVSVPVSELKGSGFPLPDQETLNLKRGKGCRQCRGTGFLGRCGVFEVFAMNEEIQKLVSSGSTSAELNRAARQDGMTSLKEDAWRKVCQGITTFEEALRVTGSGE
ncbi:MAG: GspE/PulE family protein [Desulfurivibrionaceae bacterium]